MKKFIKILSLVFVLGIIFTYSICGGLVLAKNSNDIKDLNNIASKSALLVDRASGTVIFEKNADKKLPIASMTKLVTLGVVFEALNQGKLKLDQYVVVSENAAKTEGSEAFLDANKKYLVEDLIKTVIISSANDSAVALAEAVSGSESDFVRKMNDYAVAIGMNDSLFSNATGLPAANHYSTARDMVRVYDKICDNLIYKKYSNVWIDELVHASGRKTQLVNTNKLVRFYRGSTGGKTGFTNEAGFCLTASAKKNDMTLIAVVLGEKTSSERFNTVTNMFDYGFNNFENRIVVKKDKSLGDIEIDNYYEKIAQIFPRKDYIKFLKKGDEFVYNTHLEMGKIKAPIKADQKIGSLLILDKNNIVIDEIDIITGKDIDEIKFYQVVDKIYKNW